MSSQQVLIKTFFKEHFPLHKEGLAELTAAFVIKNYPKNTVILREGDVENKLRFLTNGSIREYFISDTKEVNIHFFVKPQFITNLSSFIDRHPTRKNQETLSAIELLELDQLTFMHLLEKYSCGEALIESVFRKIVQVKEQNDFLRKTKEPEELYKIMLEEHSDWLRTIAQYHIASYLGITPETLSRIRKRIS